MISSLKQFLSIWNYESENTLKLLDALTDASLAQEVYPGGRTLGKIANHITETLTEMPSKLGLGIEEEHAAFQTAKEIADQYRRHSAQLVSRLQEKWTDADLNTKVNMYGEEWTNAIALRVLIMHQAHHRGQITVLMRQAGLKVPGVYGPAKEEWAAIGIPPMD